LVAALAGARAASRRSSSMRRRNECESFAWMTEGWEATHASIAAGSSTGSGGVRATHR
jgi:hypothetical protein